MLAETLVGRDVEMALLEDVLARSCAGACTFAALAGEPGIGKTSVIAELARRAEARGCLVLRGRASEMESELPFGLVVDALDAYIASLDASVHGRLAADGLGELASVFPSLRSLGAGTEAPRTAVERFRAYHAVRELIERLAARRPLVLELDDVHWSDGASLELIGHLLRRPPQAAVMVVAAFRTGQEDAGFAAAIEGGAREGALTSVVLGPLDRESAGSLIEATGLRGRDALYRESGGNPFYLIQLARSRPAKTVAPAAANGGVAGVPAAVTAAIAAELDPLPIQVRTFAQAASVAGDPFELDVASYTAGVEEPAALDSLDELVRRDLVRPTDVPRRFQFRHPLVRSAVYASCSPGVRLAAHERAADVLAARGAPATARAHHVEQSARHGDMTAVEVLRAAGGAAAERAPSSAARWFEAALRLLPENAPDAERAGLLIALAGSWGATGRFEDAHGAMLQTLALMAPEDRGTRVRLVAGIAGIEHLLGRHAQAHERLMDALEELPDRESPEGAALMLELALDAFYGMDYERMTMWSDEALRVANTLDDPPLTATAASIAAFAGTLRPETIGAATAHYADAVARVDALTDAELATRLEAVAWLTPAEFYMDLYESGMAHARRGLDIARATGQGEFFPTLAQALANLLFMSGRPVEAAEMLDGVVESARLSDSGVAMAWSLLNRAFAASCMGDYETALRASAEAVKLTDAAEDSPIAAWSGGAHARALFDTGDVAGAHRVLVERCGGIELPLIPGEWRAVWLELAVRCLLELGDLEQARGVAALSESIAGAYGLPLALAIADRAGATVALAGGDAALAAERALAAAARAGEVGARIEAATSKALAGRAFAALGEDDRAAAELDAALAELEACGAGARREPIEHELRRLGRSVHRRSRPGKADEKGVASLTGRELEVAHLVVDRRTNQEIAAELFLSIKTVETHMRNIFRKLDAGSRVEVARIVERSAA